MTTQQHTRWKVLADHEHQGKSLLHNHRFIAEEGAEWSENGSVEGGSLICAMRDGQHQAAHARLIAAAPELLEALNQLLLNTERTAFLAQSLDKARAAIAKATAA